MVFSILSLFPPIPCVREKQNICGIEKTLLLVDSQLLYCPSESRARVYEVFFMMSGVQYGDRVACCDQSEASRNDFINDLVRLIIARFFRLRIFHDLCSDHQSLSPHIADNVYFSCISFNRLII